MGSKSKVAGRLVKGLFNGTMTGIGLGVEAGEVALKGTSKAISLGEKPVGKVVDTAVSALSPEKLVEYDKDGWPTKFSGRGKLIVGGLIGVNMAASGYDEYENKHLGKMDGRIHTATPDYSQYVKMKTPKTTYQSAPAAADGSLVFALNNARNGGFL